MHLLDRAVDPESRTISIKGAYNLISELGREIEGLAYDVPWAHITVVVIIAYCASLLTTYLPARQAAKVYPAEALRFE